MKKRKLLMSILTVFFVCFMAVAFSACSEEHTHSYMQQITTEATCTENGVFTYTCSCNETYTVEIPALGHDDKTHEAKAPTCAGIGWNAYATCEREGCDYTTYVEIPATGNHSWNDGEITTEPTCTEKGVRTFTCTTCATANYTEDVPALDHDKVQHNAQVATCTEIGWNVYETCKREGCDYTTYVEIPATGKHSLATEYSYNQNAHWFDCDTCDEPIEIESHQKVHGECIICYATIIPNILLIERNDGESDNLKYLLESSGESVEIDTIHILADDLPTTAFELCAYDEVILVNIANADMPMGFDEILHEYVYDLGGSMLTVGGNRDVDGEIVPNAYNRKDMYGTLYQEMLPVQAIDFTPPIGVMIIIDSSASMEEVGNSGQTKLELAKEGAKASLNALTERDYVGIMTLDDTYSEELALTPRTQEAKILAAIDSIQTGGGGTIFSTALERAGSALTALANVQKKHVILITDGAPADPFESYASIMREYYEKAGITYSMIVLDYHYAPANAILREATEEYGGGRFYDVWDMDRLPMIIYEELTRPEIKAVNIQPFVPTIASNTSIVNGINQADIPELEGFYGTKLKEGATATLMAEYSPIYADWNYGNGKVGSFMCDLNMVWSQSFMLDATGQQLILNIVFSLIE